MNNEKSNFTLTIEGFNKLSENYKRLLGRDYEYHVDVKTMTVYFRMK